MASFISAIKGQEGAYGILHGWQCIYVFTSDNGTGMLLRDAMVFCGYHFLPILAQFRFAKFSQELSPAIAFQELFCFAILPSSQSQFPLNPPVPKA